MVGTYIADYAYPAIGVELDGYELYVSYMTNNYVYLDDKPGFMLCLR